MDRIILGERLLLKKEVMIFVINSIKLLEIKDIKKFLVYWKLCYFEIKDFDLIILRK